MKFNDAFEAWSRAMSLEKAVSSDAHFIRSINRMRSPVFDDSRVCSSSEKIVTQSVKTIMTCSIMIKDVRDLAASSFPIRKPCNWCRHAYMPVTSIRTRRADVGAPYARSMNGFSRRPTRTAAVVITVTDAETDRGSMSGECRSGDNSNDEHGRKTFVDRGKGRIGRTPAQAYSNPHSGHLGVDIVPSLVLVTRA